MAMFNNRVWEIIDNFKKQNGLLLSYLLILGR